MASARPQSQAAPAVIIIGAGPVGLTLASELRRYGVACRIVDGSPGTKDISKALILHVRTQEVLHAMGVIDAFLAEAKPLRTVEVYAYGQRMGQWQLDGINSPHTHPIILGQDRTEHLLEMHLNALGQQVEWHTQATAFSQTAEGVNVTLRKPDGSEEQATAQYVVSCEGSDSLVRQTLNIPFEGERYTGEQFIQTDARIRWTLPGGASYLFLTKVGYMMVIEMPHNLVRVFISLPDSDPNNKTAPTLADVQNALRELGTPEAELSEPVWLARYRTSHRTAQRFREGRAFLAGDAGHVHVPIGGQGMNTGIQDAFNLGWKLASVITGIAQPALLDTYNTERLPVAEALIHGTDQAYRFVLEPNAGQQQLIQMIVPFALQSPVVQKNFRETLEEVTIAYPASPLSLDRGGSAGPKAGERALDATVVRLADRATVHLWDALRGTQWSLLLFAGPRATPDVYRQLAAVSAEVRGRARDAVAPHLVVADAAPQEQVLWPGSVLMDRNHFLHDAYGVTAPTLYLIRPDWYVAFRGPLNASDALVAHLGSILR